MARSSFVSCPTRMRRRVAWNAMSSACRKFRVSSKQRSPDSSQQGAWKAKRRAPGRCSTGSAETGGNCRKSPQKTTCRPPKGHPGRPRAEPSPLEAISRNSPETIEISSTTSALASLRRPAWRAIMSKSSLFLPRPQPRKECSVPPPMWQAAAPVEAHTASSPSFFRRFRRASMRAQSVKDLPVPGRPVKKTFSPSHTAAKTSRCSSERRCAWGRLSHSSRLTGEVRPVVLGQGIFLPPALLPQLPPPPLSEPSIAGSMTSAP
mmetsp:Transcript_30407/g.95128  ORF Transcript_30407/g.95128 Transcript_30407/m.95128 type:complete len:263 (-) Transcript_30407:70-858(-)